MSEGRRQSQDNWQSPAACCGRTYPPVSRSAPVQAHRPAGQIKPQDTPHPTASSLRNHAWALWPDPRTRLCPPGRWHWPWDLALFSASQVARVIKNSAANIVDIQDRCGSDPWVRKIPWKRKWWPTPVFLPRESHGERRLVSYSPWAHKKSDILSD